MWICSFRLGFAGCIYIKFGLLWTLRGETAAAEMSYQDGLNLTPKQRGGT